MSVLTLDSSFIRHAAISPNGLWVAIVSEETEGFGVSIYAVESPQDRFRIGACSAACGGIKWSRSSLALLWSDDTGIWQGLPNAGAGQEPLLLAEPYLRSNIGGTNIYGAYRMESWSASGSMLLVSHAVVVDGQLAVLDIETGRVAALPGSFLYFPARLIVAWTPNDLLLIVRPSLDEESSGAVAELWGRQITAEGVLAQIQLDPISDQAGDVPFGPFPLVDGTFLTGLLKFGSTDYNPANGIYLGGIDGLKLNDLPFLPIDRVHWVPDASGVLLKTRGRTLFVPANGDPIYSLAPFLGADTCCYAWVP